MSFDTEGLQKMPADVAEREKMQQHYEWKMKIKATDILSVFFSFSARTLNGKGNNGSWRMAIAESFVKEFAIHFLEQFFKILDSRNADFFVSPFMLMNIVRIFDFALEITH